VVSRPTILTVDDDLPVLRAIERDLRTRYSKDYRIVAATSGMEALEALRELTVRGDPVALFVVDQSNFKTFNTESTLAPASFKPTFTVD
jgi:thioredoxin reductase (NADPH)